ncbi:MAG TPA: S8 family serine peptidase [Opitutaceae bacterium]|nr:S8 family serine peptidase [Opitutaceae bacterium]
MASPRISSSSMYSSSRLIVLVFISLFALARADSTGPAAPRFTAKEIQQGFRDGSILAKPKCNISETVLRARESRGGAKLHRLFKRINALRVLEFSPTQDVSQTIDSLRASGLYEYVEPNYLRHAMVVPNDPRFGDQWALQNSGQSGGTSGADIKAVSAWDVRSSPGSIIVAVLDSGVRASHEDLAANLWVNPKETAGNGVDDDGNGYVDDVNGMYSLVATGAANSGDITDKVGHGTSVASVIGAVGNNGKGIAGIAWNVKMMICRMADNGGEAATSDIIESVDYAVANGAKIINISYGGRGYSNAEYDSMAKARDAGVIIVASAGNDGVSDQIKANYPASIPLENIISVANTTRTDALAPSSVYGGLVELGAPGTDILAASKDGDSSYDYVTGTSLSAPMVSGSLALLAAQFPSDNYRQLINRLLRSVDKIPALNGKVQTGGRLNLNKALNSAAGANTPFNDNFADRAKIDGETVNTRGVSVGATPEPSEPSHGAAGGASLWWTWTAPRSGTAVVDTAASSFDTTVAVYTGSTLVGLTQVAANDDSDGTTTSHLSFAVVSGTAYHIAVDGKGGATGLIQLSLGLAPANDDFANAVTLSGATGKSSGTNHGATRQAGEPTASSDAGATGNGRTVWYSWTAPKSGRFGFSVPTQIFTPIVSVYTGSSVNALSLIASQVNDCDFTATSGVTYKIAVDTADVAGSFTLVYTEGYAFTIDAHVYSSAAITLDDVLVFATNAGTLFYSSSNYWFDNLVGQLDISTPALGTDGTIYITTSTSLYAIAADKTHKWTKDLDDGFGSSPALTSAGNIVVHSNDGFLRVYSPSGTELWSTAVTGNSYSSPSIAPDGTIYIGSTDHNLYAVNGDTGAVKWKYDTGGEIYASPAIGTDGTIYIGTMSSKFLAVKPTGSLAWSYSTGDSITSSAAIAADGSLYFGCYDKKVYCLTSGGTLKWSYTTGDQIRASSPAIGSDGTVYIGSYDGCLYVISSTGALTKKYQTGSYIRSSPMLIEDAVVVGSDDGRYYILTATGEGMANSPWPTYRQNVQRTGRKSLNTAPSITTQPSATVVAIGGSATLSVSAQGQDPLTYQWYLNGAAIPGATQSSYTITNASDANAGNYTVVVTNALGSITSGVATVTVATASNLGRIVNMSARAIAGTDAKTLIVGLVISDGPGTKSMLIRGVGATLAQAPYNVPGVLADPTLRLFPGGSDKPIATNDDWGTDPKVPALMTQTGAFAFLSAKDAAMAADLASGGYTVHVTSTASASGVALAEFYDATQVFTADTPRLINISARSQVGTGGDVLIVGFVIGGATPVKVLIRGIGPTLGDSRFQVPGVLADPKLTLRILGKEDVLQENDNWGASANVAELQAAMTSANAFSLSADSKDAMIVATLQPGAYTAVISGVNNTTGVALAEVYELK